MEQKIHMVKVQVTLSEEEDETVRLVKAKENLSSKEKAIKKIIREHSD